MFRLLGAGVIALTLAGCATSGAPHWWRALAGVPPVSGPFRFDWQIAGDPSLAPLQVFDDGHQTWLQYPAGQPAPALFERTPAGDRLLHPRREGDYLVVRGVPERLVVRGGHIQAQIWRDATAASSPGAGSPSASAAPPGASGPHAALSGARPTVGPSASIPVPVESAPVIVPAVLPDAGSAAPARALVPPPPPPPIPVISPPAPQPPSPALSSSSRAQSGAMPQRAPAMRSSTAGTRVPQGLKPAVAPLAVSDRPRLQRPFEATPADGNIRRALWRWAQSAGWVFEAEHWAVDVDIPLAGSAAFGDEFVPAVRGLLAATELGDRPLQPCFYANQVLRVVPLAQRCDRTQAPGAPS